MLERFLEDATSEIAHAVEPTCILFIRKVDNDPSDEEMQVSLHIIREDKEKIRKTKERMSVKRLPPSSITRIREIVIEAVNEGYIPEGDKVFCITDESLGRGFEGLFFIFEIDEEFMKLTTKGLEEDMEEGILESVLSIARELAREGREGKPVGTGFVVGDHEKVLERSKQLVLNPFDGVPIDERNVSDVKLKETVKEFAQIDGVFVLDGEGFIRSAGRYLNVDTSSVEFPGMGARHHACSAITESTDARSVCVSADGSVRVFKDGNLIVEERAR